LRWTLRTSCISVLSTCVVVAACARQTEVPINAVPACAWNVEQSSRTLGEVNFAAPDTAAAYWGLRYVVQPGLTLTVRGQFPNARYMSFSTYDSRFRSFTVNGVDSGIADYRIEPDHGGANPSPQPSAPGATYTVTVRSDVKAGHANTLPLAPAGTDNGTSGYLILRTYLPANGPSAVKLPTVTFSASSSAARTISPCISHNTELPVKVTRQGVRSGQPLPNQQPSTDFARFQASTASAFPNVDNAYLRYTLTPPPADQVLVVQGKAPAHPGDVRYFSLCSYPAIFPAPVTRNQMPDGSDDDGCRDDDETKLDVKGFYTYVVGTEAQRAQIESVSGLTFVPLSAAHPQQNHLLLLRNLLPNNNFNQAIQNVPPGSTPDQAAATMGEYYPRTRLCPLSALAADGLSACVGRR
jgi:hypothetical protein